MPRRSAVSAATLTRLHKVAEAQRAGQFVALCVRLGLPKPELEYRFHPKRKWRIDFAWNLIARRQMVPESPAVSLPPCVYDEPERIALEVNGGIFTQGRHARGAGLLKEYEKMNALALAGYRVFHVTPDQLNNYATVQMIGQALGIGIPKLGQIK